LLVQALVPQKSVECFNERIIHWFSLSPADELHVMLMRPASSALLWNSGPLSTVIRWGNPRVVRRRSRTATTRAAQARIDFDHASLAREHVDERQETKGALIGSGSRTKSIAHCSFARDDPGTTTRGVATRLRP
jgi:hypothetical protein